MADRSILHTPRRTMAYYNCIAGAPEQSYTELTGVQLSYSDAMAAMRHELLFRTLGKTLLEYLSPVDL
jgi:hypothetical protein